MATPKDKLANSLPDDSAIVEGDGLRLFSVPAALVAVSEDYFRRRPTDARAAIATIKDASDVLALLIEGGHSPLPVGWPACSATARARASPTRS